MTNYRDSLPQLSDTFVITDGGIETTLIFHENLELPYFAAFHLLKDEAGCEALRKYFRTYAELAKRCQKGLILESPTWRANPDWGLKLGYTPEALAAANRKAIDLLCEIRDEFETEERPMVISGCVGPRGDGYVPAEAMSVQEAQEYHRGQVEIFSRSRADLVTAITMNYVAEAIGIVKAAGKFGMPAVISFTVETDGKLPTGESLKESIERVDAATDGGPAYYMINCAHPTHFEHALAAGESWTGRIRGLRTNASTKSHAELNESAELDEGDPVALARQHRELQSRLKKLTIFGGCCGTDHRHVEEICKACITK